MDFIVHKGYDPNIFGDYNPYFKTVGGNGDLLDLQWYLSPLLAIDPRLIVAGGYVRDTILGIRPNDVDVFIGNKSQSLTLGQIDTCFRAIGYRLSDQKFGDDIPQDYKLNPNIRFVATLKKDTLHGAHYERDIQIVWMKRSTEGVVEQFPVDISQAWWNPASNYFGVTRLCASAMDSKVIQKVNPVYADGHRYLEKIRAKFQPLGYECRF